MKKAITLIITLFTVLFVSFAIISFMYYSSINQTSQYHKDLAELRGYWAAYGAKEKNSSTDILYYYHDLSVENENGNGSKFVYIIRGKKTNNNNFTFEIVSSESVKINKQNSDIYTRTLKISGGNSNKMVSYK